MLGKLTLGCLLFISCAGP